MGELRECRFRAMGSACRVVTRGGPRCSERVRDLVLALEARWSRFRPDSEVSVLNRYCGQICVVSEPTFGLVELAQRARVLTGGRFNPLMESQLRRLGYDRSWETGVSESSDRPPEPASRQPIELLADASAVIIPPGTGFDPGGIGKGLAADLAVDAAVSDGAASVLVELGGDLRVAGQAWDGSDWEVDVEHPHDSGREVARFRCAAGAVTTSSTLRRRWRRGETLVHHLLDPDTGAPAVTDLVAVTTAGTEAWWSEVVSKTALVAGSDGVLDTLGALATPGVAVTVDGRVLTTDGVAT